MMYTPFQQIDTARSMPHVAQPKIKTQPGMQMGIMLHPTNNLFGTPEEMMDVVAATLGIDPIYYKVKTRVRDVVEMRFIAAVLLRIHFPRVTLCQIAALYGGQDHTSILNGIGRAYKLIHTGDHIFINKYNSAVVAVNKWLKHKSAIYTAALSA